MVVTGQAISNGVVGTREPLAVIGGTSLVMDPGMLPSCKEPDMVLDIVSVGDNEVGLVEPACSRGAVGKAQGDGLWGEVSFKGVNPRANEGCKEFQQVDGGTIE